MNNLIFSNKIKGLDKDDFINKVILISSELGYNPNWLMVIMNSETGGSFSSSKESTLGSVGNKAVGLIQFMPSTAISLGTTSAKLKSMNRVDQLDYVKKYYQNTEKMIGKKPTSFDQLYLMTFYPNAINKPDSYVFGSEVSDQRAIQIYKQNPMAKNSNQKLTLGDFKAWLKKILDNSISKEDQSLLGRGFEFLKENKKTILGFLVFCALVGGTVWYLKHKTNFKIS